MERSISGREWLVACLVALLLAIILMAPYILGYNLVQPDKVYTGILMNAEDSQSYFAKMRQGYEGRWVYHIPFTPEEHAGAFVGGYYLGLGHMARILDLSLATIWHGARFFSGFVLFLSTFLFTGIFFRSRKSHWVAYLMALTGSGLGWLLFALGQSYWLSAFPVDFKMPEAHLFFSAMAFSHVSFGTAFLLSSFAFALRAAQDRMRTWRFAIFSGLSMLILTVLYPFMIYLVIAVLGAFWAYRSIRVKAPQWRALMVYIVASLFPAPLLIYYAYVLQNNGVFKAWAEQSATLSPPLPHYLVAFGPMLILAVIPTIRRSRQPGDRSNLNFLWIWIGVAAVMLFAPLNQQRRFVQGLHVALAILATNGLVTSFLPWLLAKEPIKKLTTYPRYTLVGLERFLLFAVLVFMSISNFYLLADVSVTSAIRQPSPFFRSKAEARASEWLKANTQGSDIVMASSASGNFIAAQVGNPVVSGHWAETVDYAQKTLESEKFFAAETSDAWRQQILAKYEVDYVWYGPLERRLGDFDPATTQYLKPSYDKAGIAIFSVR